MEGDDAPERAGAISADQGNGEGEGAGEGEGRGGGEGVLFVSVDDEAFLETGDDGSMAASKHSPSMCAFLRRVISAASLPRWPPRAREARVSAASLGVLVGIAVAGERLEVRQISERPLMSAGRRRPAGRSGPGSAAPPRMSARLVPVSGLG